MLATRTPEDDSSKSRYYSYFQKYRVTPKGKYHIYRGDAKRRGIIMKLTFSQFSKIISQPCKYCGDTGSHIGIDRVNNSVGYLNGNCVACCKYCNYMKKDMSSDDFLDHVIKISAHNLLNR